MAGERVRKLKLPDWNWWPALPLGVLMALAIWGLTLPQTKPNPQPIHSAERAADKKAGDPNEELAAYTLWLTIFTGVLALVGMTQGWLIREQIKLARDEFNSTHRPRLRVRNIFLGGPQPFQSSAFSKGNLVSGQFYVANIGDMPAHIVESHCEFLWNVNGLPMKRPYEGLDGNHPLIIQTIAAGSSATATFQSYDLYPLEGTPGTEVILPRLSGHPC